jgi:hypothetical protein
MEKIIRPDAVVLGDGALIPDGNLISPPPNQFTHELTVDQPFYYSKVRDDQAPNGEFAAGTKIVLLVDNGQYCRVVDKQGLYVDTLSAGLRHL